MTIAGDTKDWTWVLERPCPECGLAAGEIARERIAPALEATARRWAEVLRQGAPADLRARPDPSVWSTLEYGCHARDVYLKAHERAAAMLEQDHPTIANWDQDETAVAERYQDQDPLDVAARLGAAASALVALYGSLRGSDWQRRGRRSDGAEFTVASFGRYVVHDPYHHLIDVGIQIRL